MRERAWNHTWGQEKPRGMGKGASRGGGANWEPPSHRRCLVPIYTMECERAWSGPADLAGGWSMRKNRQRRNLLLAAWVWAWVGLWSEAEGQVVTRRGAGATLPESNEAMLLSNQAEEAMARGDFRLVIQLIDRISALGDELVADARGSVYYPVWRQSQRLLEKLPAEGVALYRQLKDAEFEARCRDALRAGDLNGLRRLIREHSMATSAGEMARELCARLLDEGRFQEAVDAIFELSELPGGEEEAFDRRAQMLVALVQTRSWSTASTLLAELERKAADGANPRRSARVGQIRLWFEGRLASSIGGEREELNPLLEGARAWTKAISSDREHDLLDDDRTIASVIQNARRLPLIEPVATADSLVVRVRGQTHVFDSLTLARRWSVAEIGSGQPEWSRSRSRFGASDGDSGDAVSPDARHLVWHWLRHAATVGFGCVYTVESLTPLNDESLARQHAARFFTEADEPTNPNELVARRLSNGEAVWRIGSDDRHTLFEVIFQDRPLVVGDLLAVPVQRGQEIHLCFLDPRDGALLREIGIAGPPTKLPPEAGRCQLATDGASVYVSTGNGIVASISAATYEWRWAAEYPTMLANERARRAIPWRYDLALPMTPGASRPIVAGDLLIVSPADSEQVIALDRYTGRQRWTAPRGDVMTVVGVVEDGLILAGGRVVRVSLADGVTVQWRTISLELTGRPEIAGSRIYVPVRTGLIVLDAQTGKIVGEHASGRVSVGSLAVTREAVYRVSANELVKHPDVRAVEERCRAIAESNPRDARPKLASAWLETVRGRHEEALSLIAGLQSDDPSVAADRDVMLASLVTMIARGPSPIGEKVAMLRKAQATAASGPAASRLSVAIARMLEEGEGRREALERYERVLLSTDEVFLEDAGLEEASGVAASVEPGEGTGGTGASDAGYRLAAWLYAARRIREMLPRMSDEEQWNWMTGAFERRRKGGEPTSEGAAGRAPDVASQIRRLAREDAVGLARMAAVLPEGRARENAEAAALMATLAPELADRYVRRDYGHVGEASLRRELHLARWVTNLSLGKVEAAEADEREWNTALTPRPASRPVEGELGGATQPAATMEVSSSQPSLVEAGPEELTTEMREALSFAERVGRKLRRSVEPEFTLEMTKRWTVADGLLIVDPSGTDFTSCSTILAHERTGRKLELRRLSMGAALRETSAGTISGGAASLREESLEAAEEILSGLRLDPDSIRAPLPALMYESLAVVPVRGGLVCVGTGPEGRAGNRLWEFSMSEPIDVFEDFPDRSAAGPHGVYISPRPDRIVALDWLEGRVRWRRDFDPARFEVRRMVRIGEELVLIGFDGQLMVVSAEYGDNPRRLPGEFASSAHVAALAFPRELAGSGSGAGMIVVADRDDLAGVVVGGAKQGQVAWRRTLPGNVGLLMTFAGSTWIGVREEGGAGWRLVDAATGQDALPLLIETRGTPKAVAVEGGSVLVSAFEGGEVRDAEDEGVRGGRGGRLGRVFIAAYDREGGVPRWTRRIETAAAVNLSQLTARRAWLPILVTDADGAEVDAQRIRRATIQLLDKSNGETVKTIDIELTQRGGFSAKSVYLLATPTRLVVQLGATMVAYGNSRLGAAP